MVNSKMISKKFETHSKLTFKALFEKNTHKIMIKHHEFFTIYPEFCAEFKNVA